MMCIQARSVGNDSGPAFRNFWTDWLGGWLWGVCIGGPLRCWRDSLFAVSESDLFQEYVVEAARTIDVGPFAHALWFFRPQRSIPRQNMFGDGKEKIELKMIPVPHSEIFSSLAAWSANPHSEIFRVE